MARPPLTARFPSLLRRRRFVGWLSLLAAAGWTASRLTVREPAAGRTLEPQETRTLGALCEQIMPADELPGAIEAGVLEFMDRQLRPGGLIGAVLPLYRRGLAVLDAAVRQTHGGTLAHLPLAQQTAVLEAMERDALAPTLWDEPRASVFLRRVIDDTKLGYFSHPRYGGNRNLVGYQLLGVRYPVVLQTGPFPPA